MTKLDYQQLSFNFSSNATTFDQLKHVPSFEKIKEFFDPSMDLFVQKTQTIRKTDKQFDRTEISLASISTARHAVHINSWSDTPIFHLIDIAGWCLAQTLTSATNISSLASSESRKALRRFSTRNVVSLFPIELFCAQPHQFSFSVDLDTKDIWIEAGFIIVPRHSGNRAKLKVQDFESQCRIWIVSKLVFNPNKSNYIPCADSCFVISSTDLTTPPMVYKSLPEAKPDNVGFTSYFQLDLGQARRGLSFPSPHFSSILLPTSFLRSYNVFGTKSGESFAFHVEDILKAHNLQEYHVGFTRENLTKLLFKNIDTLNRESIFCISNVHLSHLNRNDPFYFLIASSDFSQFVRSMWPGASPSLVKTIATLAKLSQEEELHYHADLRNICQYLIALTTKLESHYQDATITSYIYMKVVALVESILEQNQRFTSFFAKQSISKPTSQDKKRCFSSFSSDLLDPQKDDQTTISEIYPTWESFASRYEEVGITGYRFAEAWNISVILEDPVFSSFLRKKQYGLLKEYIDCLFNVLRAPWIMGRYWMYQRNQAPQYRYALAPDENIVELVADTVRGLKSCILNDAKAESFAKYAFSRLKTRKIRNFHDYHDFHSKVIQDFKHTPLPIPKKNYFFLGPEDKIFVPHTPYVIHVPTDTNEIRRWGQRQSHCIANYAESTLNKANMVLGVWNVPDDKWFGHLAYYFFSEELIDQWVKKWLQENSSIHEGMSINSIAKMVEASIPSSYIVKPQQFYGARNSHLPEEEKQKVIKFLNSKLYEYTANLVKQHLAKSLVKA